MCGVKALAGVGQSLGALDAGATPAAWLGAPFVTAVGVVIVDAELQAAQADLAFGEPGVGAFKADAGECALGDGASHGVDESGAAVGVNGVVARMVGEHHGGEAAALGESGGHGEHDAVAEGHDGRAHIVVGVMPFGDGVGAAEQRAFEVLAHESEGYLDVLYTQAPAVVAGAFGLAFVVVGAVVECHRQGDAVGAVVEQGG